MRLIKKLPDPFVSGSGDRVTTVEDWASRRAEILDLLLNTEYGTMPDAPDICSGIVGNWHETEGGHRSRTDCLTFTPHQDKPRISFDLEITITHPSETVLERKRSQIPGFDGDGCPVLIYVGGKTHEAVVDNGYIVVNYPNDTLEPMEIGKPKLGPARQAYRDLYKDQYSWGSISAWAWGARRVLDYAMRLPEVDGSRAVISGHSRNGKTALLAGALDDRFAVVNPAGSGCAGAGSYLALGDDCEDLPALTSRERWWAWTHPDFENWAGKEADLPFDQHFLMSLVAPRPLLRTEGVDDHWANPMGTSVSFLATQPVYDFLGVPQNNTIYYRQGGHDHTEEDAKALMDLCDARFFGQQHQFDLSHPLTTTPPSDTVIDWQAPGIAE